jgi:UDP-2,3-diacylglucosamine hydrolase
MDNKEAPIYFISDAHLGLPIKGCDSREEHLIDFLREIASGGSDLYIVGDLFDFWIEYGRAIRPDYFFILCELSQLVKKGVVIHYLAGNHDFALGPFIEKTIGVETHLDHYETLLQGKKIHLYHGDGLIRHDVGYRILKKILRFPLNQKIYKCIHPNIGVPLGSICSGSSRKVTSRFITENVLQEYRDHAFEYLKQGNDIVVFGHTHRPEIKHWDGKTYCNTGEWIEKYTFAKLENGKMTLWQYKPGEKPQEIVESSLKKGSNAS